MSINLYKPINIFSIILLLFCITLYGHSVELGKTSLQEGKELLQQKEYQQAVTFFSKITQSGKSAEAWYLLGLSYLHLKKFKMAEMAFLQASHLDTNIKFADKKKFYQQLRQSQHQPKLKTKELSDWIDKFPWKKLLWITLLMFTILLLLWSIKKKKQLKQYKVPSMQIKQTVKSLKELWQLMNHELESLKKLELKINESSQYQMKHLITSIRNIEKKISYYNNQYESYLLQMKGTNTENELKQNIKDTIKDTREIQVSLEISTRSAL